MFFDAISFDDLTIRPNLKGKGKSFNALNNSMLTVLQKFKSIRENTETKHLFNTNILQNVGVGIIAFDSNGNVEFSNKLFHNMTQVPYCMDLEKIKKFNASLHNQIINIKNKKKDLYKTEINGVLQHYLLTPSKFSVKDKQITLVVVQNIQPTIDQTEMEAWQKLIRVLTHEIMNSITPISSLSETVSSMLPQDDTQQIDAETKSDLKEALATITKRSNGLINFVQEYRSLTAIPQPKLDIIPVDELLQSINLLFTSDLQGQNIKFTYKTIGNNLDIIADCSLIEQVILNLLKNAKYAVAKIEQAEISLIAKENEFGKVEIYIRDNGVGILPDVLDKIFIPFFTTKSIGSGIGLSLSKQIMVLHGGNITVHSTPEKGSEFVLRF